MSVFESCHDFGGIPHSFKFQDVNFIEILCEYVTLMPSYYYFFYDLIELCIGFYHNRTY